MLLFVSIQRTGQFSREERVRKHPFEVVQIRQGVRLPCFRNGLERCTQQEVRGDQMRPEPQGDHDRRTEFRAPAVNEDTMPPFHRTQNQFEQGVEQQYESFFRLHAVVVVSDMPRYGATKVVG